MVEDVGRGLGSLQVDNMCHGGAQRGHGYYCKMSVAAHTEKNKTETNSCLTGWWRRKRSAMTQRQQERVGPKVWGSVAASCFYCGEDCVLSHWTNKYIAQRIEKEKLVKEDLLDALNVVADAIANVKS